jgi:FdrA protein
MRLERSRYHDSVVLLHLARELRALPDVEEAAALMGTPANRELLAGAGLAAPELAGAGPNDLLIAVRAASARAAEAALERAASLLAARRRQVEAAPRPRPRTLERAVERLPGANLALVSVPGPWAAAEARRALRLGLHVLLFSDNVPLEEEVALKRLALARGRFCLGPDCGTAYVAGVPLGFANAVPRGRVGLVAASGTGLQQVSVLLAAAGEGVSHGIGVGGRDMTAAVGGLMTLAALDALAADAATEVVVVLGKPPDPAVRRAVEARLDGLGKPAVVALLGAGAETRIAPGRITVTTLEDAAAAAVALRRQASFAPRPFTAPAGEIRRRVRELRRGLGPGQRGVRGLYAGGSLAHEARLILEPLLGPVEGNLGPAPPGALHRLLDLGADEYTAGRAHPMIDPRTRVAAILEAGEDPAAAVLLLDVVLGHGAASDPAGDLLPALEQARAAAAARGRALPVVATVVGAAGDPQGHAGQVARLAAASVWVLPSNAQAARAAAAVAGGEAVLDRLLGGAS